ncbi:hypothetical protein IE077_000198 [Cardiosporidium cionae]|uniref:Uncharacterized protein n=1 Tax=Cardiosporidium cionae TaxID=476202 RepID=A0ABQ7JCJ1_9APIC|nr:hypothetical protein IE077_000198 [Cardiosporidium cionae]|eukprot:KAF8821753.1 hypothetical protein IE077_000198 [Cardiosporidium cionae]
MILNFVVVSCLLTALAITVRDKSSGTVTASIQIIATRQLETFTKNATKKVTVPPGLKPQQKILKDAQLPFPVKYLRTPRRELIKKAQNLIFHNLFTNIHQRGWLLPDATYPEEQIHGNMETRKDIYRNFNEAKERSDPLAPEGFYDAEPSAWCTKSGIAIAIPLDTPLLSLEKQGKMNLQSAKWRHADNSCSVSLVQDFFANDEHRKLDAWVAFAPFGKCGGTIKESSSHIFVFNTLNVPAPGRSVAAACSCLKSGVDMNEDRDRYHASTCIPFVRWSNVTASSPTVQDDFLEIPILKFLPTKEKTRIPSRLSTATQLPTMPTESAYPPAFFKAHAQGKKGYLWPQQCTVNVTQGNSEAAIVPLIINGCPVSPMLEFTVHDTDESEKWLPSKKNYDSASTQILFSISPRYILEKLGLSSQNPRIDHTVYAFPIFAKFSCDMGLFPTRQSAQRICRKAEFERQSFDLSSKISKSNKINTEIFESMQSNHMHSTVENSCGTPNESPQCSYIVQYKNRKLQFEINKIDDMKPEFIKLNGPQQISSWKNYKKKDYLEDYWRKIEKETARNFQLERKQKQIEQEQKRPATTGTQQQLQQRQDLLSLAMKQHADFQQYKSTAESMPASINSSRQFDMTWGVSKDEMYSPASRKYDEAYDRYVSEHVQGRDSVAGQIFHRYIPTTDRVIDSIDNTIVYGPWAVNWISSQSEERRSVQVGNSRGAVGISASVPREITGTTVNWGTNAINVLTDSIQERVRLAVLHGRYGVSIDRSDSLQSATVETVSRFVETATLVDLLNRIYGERIRVRNFDFAFRRHFAAQASSAALLRQNPLTQEIALNYRAISIVVGSNRVDREFLTSVGLRGYQFTALRDFDENIFDFQGNWGNGWQTSIQTDFIDPQSSQIFTGFEFGKLGRAYAAVGAGVGNDGVPQGTATVQTADLGLTVEFIDTGVRRFNYALTIGKFTYTWESSLNLNNLLLPVIVFPPIVETV